MRPRILIAAAALLAALAGSAAAGITSIIPLPQGPNGSLQFQSNGGFSYDPTLYFSTGTERLHLPAIQFPDNTVQTTAAGAATGVTVYPATAPASFPFGLNVTTPTVNGIPYKFPLVLPASGYAIWLVDAAGNVSTSTVITDGARLASTQTFSGANTFKNDSHLILLSPTLFSGLFPGIDFYNRGFSGNQFLGQIQMNGAGRFQVLSSTGAEFFGIDNAGNAAVIGATTSISGSLDASQQFRLYQTNTSNGGTPEVLIATFTADNSGTFHNNHALLWAKMQGASGNDSTFLVGASTSSPRDYPFGGSPYNGGFIRFWPSGDVTMEGFGTQFFSGTGGASSLVTLGAAGGRVDVPSGVPFTVSSETVSTQIQTPILKFLDGTTQTTAASSPFSNATSSTSLSIGNNSLTDIGSLSGPVGLSAVPFGVDGDSSVTFEKGALLVNYKTSNGLSLIAGNSVGGDADWELGGVTVSDANYPGASNAGRLHFRQGANSAIDLYGPMTNLSDQLRYILPQSRPSVGQYMKVAADDGSFTELGWGTPAAGGTVYPSAPLNSRLTTQSGVEISTADRTSQGNVYYTSGTIALYDGSAWTNYSHGEVSLSITVSTATNYDVWASTAGGGNIQISLSSAWSDDTTRTDSITVQDGAWVKSTDKTKRLVGTIRGTGTNVTEDSAKRRFVWNAYNPTARQVAAIDATSSWTYQSTSFRPLNFDNVLMGDRIEVLTGLQRGEIQLGITEHYYDNAGTLYTVGIGINRFTGSDASTNGSLVDQGSFSRTPSHAELSHAPRAGYTYYQAVEACEGVGNATTVENADSGVHIHGGMIGTFRE